MATRWRHVPSSTPLAPENAFESNLFFLIFVSSFFYLILDSIPFFPPFSYFFFFSYFQKKMANRMTFIIDGGTPSAAAAALFPAMHVISCLQIRARGGGGFASHVAHRIFPGRAMEGGGRAAAWPTGRPVKKSTWPTRQGCHPELPTRQHRCRPGAHINCRSGTPTPTSYVQAQLPLSHPTSDAATITIRNTKKIKCVYLLRSGTEPAARVRCLGVVL